MNFQNSENKCFRWCHMWNLNKITQSDKNSAKKLSCESVRFSVYFKGNYEIEDNFLINI